MARFTFASATPSNIITLAAASFAALGLAYVVPGGAAATPADEYLENAAPAPSVYRVVNHIEGADCEARPGPHISSTYRPVELTEACVAVLPTLETAVLWREGRDGSVSLVDETGKLVVAFAVADGPALEAIEPRNAMLSLKAL